MELKIKDYMNNKGFTLVEILVGASLMGLVSIASLSMLQNSQNADKHFDKKSDSILFLSSFGQYLLSQEGCSQFINDTPTTAYQIKEINAYKGFGSSINPLNPIRAGYILKRNHVEVESFEYRFKDDAVMVSKIIDGDMKRQQVLQIRLRVRISQKEKTLDDGNHRINEKFYEVPVLTNEADQIESCNINLTQAQICDTLSLIYVPATESCEPDPGATSCLVKGSYATISCSPAGYSCNTSFGGNGDNPFLSPPAQNCGAGETAYRTGYRQSSYTVGCGKKCTMRIYRYETFYTCMICP
ncbi:MAG: prepilin-type N-terminal cleavage/methylation domain-containing protein [Bacteriovoracaceae bacterium]|jgi:prepilin-type N-terminal cleavage/methylation domain-containing protein|nr:prepilin-type N-terminal cleavage/methylation domain-containing protein [Bacteriovoracaceae bacterium]